MYRITHLAVTVLVCPQIVHERSINKRDHYCASFITQLIILWIEFFLGHKNEFITPWLASTCDIEGYKW